MEVEKENCTCGFKKGFTKEIDSDWWVCAICLKPSIHLLNQCDTCSRFFKGIYGIEFAYTCPRCE